MFHFPREGKIVFLFCCRRKENSKKEKENKMEEQKMKIEKNEIIQNMSWYAWIYVCYKINSLKFSSHVYDIQLNFLTVHNTLLCYLKMKILFLPFLFYARTYTRMYALNHSLFTQSLTRSFAHSFTCRFFNLIFFHYLFTFGKNIVHRGTYVMRRRRTSSILIS